MPWVGFKHTIPASEWAKGVHTLDRSATVTGVVHYINKNIKLSIYACHLWDTSLNLGLHAPMDNM
jgi:hypothetical protein